MDLKDLNPADLDFPKGTKLFINDSLCPFYRRFSNECRMQNTIEQCFFFSFFVVNGTVRLKLIQLIQDGPYNSITHNDDLKNIFPKEIFTM